MRTNLRRTAPAATAAVCLLALAGCTVAIGSGSEPSRTYTTGQWIQHQAAASNAERDLAQRVTAALEDDPLLKDADVDARVTEGVVTLTGQVFDLATYEHAVEVVQKVPGVASVVSRIELNTGGQ